MLPVVEIKGANVVGQKMSMIDLFVTVLLGYGNGGLGVDRATISTATAGGDRAVRQMLTAHGTAAVSVKNWSVRC